MVRKHRDYDNDYPSVTTVLSVLRKIGLENWFKFNTIRFINNATLKGKTIGTQTHQAIEHYINTGEAKIETEYPEEVTNALKSFMLFRKEHKDLIINSSEIPLVSENHKFNGTIDAPCPPILFDWKTSECKKEEKPPIYDEWRYQTSAYVKLWNENNPDKPITDALIISIAKDKISYSLHRMELTEIEECFSEVFLSCLKITKYQRSKKWAITKTI